MYEIIIDDQYGFRHNRSTTYQTFCIRQIVEKNWSTMRQYISFSYTLGESFRKEVLCNILIESGVPMKVVRLINMCLNETYNTVCIGKYLSDPLRIKMA
jgi:hypothetical protein